MSKEFNDWWNGDDLTIDNPYDELSPAYWAWEGWIGCVKALEHQKREWVGLTNEDVQTMALSGLFLKDIYVISAVIESMLRKKNT